MEPNRSFRVGAVAVDRSGEQSGSTWREDWRLPKRLSSERARWPLRSSRRRGVRLRESWTSDRWFRRVLVSAGLFLAVLVGLQLPFGVGAQLRETLVRVLRTHTDLVETAATLRELAERGRQWTVAELDQVPGFPVTTPGDELPSEGVPSEDAPIAWSWPVEGDIVTSFGWEWGAEGGEAAFHPRIDIAAEPGSTVSASADGVVVRVEEMDEAGLWMVELDHSGGWATRYLKIADPRVRSGETVSQGDPLGVLGDPEGILGFEMLSDGLRVDPEPKLHRGRMGS